MKTYRKNSQRWLVIIGTVGFLSLLLSSCLKDHNTGPTPPFAFVSVMQSSTDASAADFYLDNNRVNQQPLSYGNYIDYFQAYTGKRTAYFYKTGTMDKLASDTIHLDDQHTYSLFLANSIAKPDFVLLTDSISRPSSGNAAIRFVNVSPDAPAADLAIKSGAVLASNKAYKQASPFVSVQGNTTYTFEVRQQGTSTVLATLSGVNVRSGFVYTIWFHGLATNPGSTPLTADLITNAYYN